jgi:hypothetical protein
MRLLSVTGVSAKGRVWTVNLPEASRVVSFGDRLLVASPVNLMWIDGEGELHQATSYPKVYQDND